MLDNVVTNAVLIANLLQVMLSKVHHERLGRILTQIGPNVKREKEKKLNETLK